MVTAGLTVMVDEPEGVSLVKLTKWIQSEYPECDLKPKLVSAALKKGITAGKFYKIKASFALMLSDEKMRAKARKAEGLSQEDQDYLDAYKGPEALENVKLWLQGKYVMPQSMCDFNGYCADCENEGSKLVLVLNGNYWHHEPSESGPGGFSTGADHAMARISIPENLRKSGKTYVFSLIKNRGNGSFISSGRICYMETKV